MPPICGASEEPLWGYLLGCENVWLQPVLTVSKTFVMANVLLAGFSTARVEDQKAFLDQREAWVFHGGSEQLHDPYPLPTAA